MSTTEFLNTDPFDAARNAAAYIAEETGIDAHDVALVLGSGWADAADLIGETTATLSADEVPGFTSPSVVGHVGTIRSVLTKEGKRALVLGARTTTTRAKACAPWCTASAPPRLPAARPWS